MITPYKRRPPHRTVAFLDRDGKVLAEDGRRNRSGNGAVVYTDLDRASILLRRGFGKALCWAGRPIRLITADVEAIVLSINAMVDDAGDFMDGLVDWRDWVEEYGAGISSIGSTSYSLMRATLARPFTTNDGDVPPVRVLVGGRAESMRPKGTITGDLYQYDLTAAYPTAMAEMRFGRAGWERVGRVGLDRVEMWTRNGLLTFVHCKVRYSGHSPGPLPKRPLRQYTADAQILRGQEYPWEGRRQGVWTGPEVLAAAANDTHVEVLDVWVNGGEDRPFEPFYEAGVEGRVMSGVAGRLAKSTSNALWGQFAINDKEDRAYLSFEEDRRRVQHLPHMRGRPRDVPLAESVTGAVRARLYSELLVPAGRQLISAQIDGGWVEGDFTPVEGWKRKRRASVMDYLGPQTYAVLDADTGEVQYVMSGQPVREAQRAFREHWQGSMSRKPMVG